MKKKEEANNNREKMKKIYKNKIEKEKTDENKNEKRILKPKQINHH